MIKILVFILIIIVVYESIHQYLRQQDRKNIFLKAEFKAKELRKPLVVIGDPNNGGGSKLWGKMYHGGDYCIDLTGCPLEKKTIGIKGDVIESLKQFSDNSVVIYISCVLEYVTDIETCIHEIKRVAGKHIYVVKVSPYSLMSRFYFMKLGDGSESKNIIYKAPPYDDFSYKKINLK